MTFEIDVLFKIAAIGIAIALLNQILAKAGRDEEAMMITLAGVGNHCAGCRHQDGGSFFCRDQSFS